MKTQRAQRLFFGLLILAGLFILHTGRPCGEYLLWLTGGVSFMAGITGFCPSEWFFRKLFGE